MFDNVQINEILASAIVGIAVFFWNWLAKKLKMKEIDAEFGRTLLAFVQREKDKYLAELADAQSPDSPGGVKVTKEELSIARNNVWERFKTDPNIKQEVKDYAMERGEQVVKGLAGNLLDKISGKK